MKNPCKDCITYAACQARYTHYFNRAIIKKFNLVESNDICMLKLSSKCNLLEDYLVEYIKDRPASSYYYYPILFRRPRS